MANIDNVRKETHARSVIKTITWRVLATLTTAILVYIFTGDLTIAVEVGGLEAVAKLIFYYLHERGWSYMKWGIKES